jgi:hypothetical protein
MDLIILFYHDSDYSLSVKEFLDSYFQQSYTEPDANVWERSHSIIRGRCGYIRQSFPLIFENYDYSKFSFGIDGINTNVSDMDFYDQIRKAIKSTSIGVDVSLPNYFKKNPFLLKLRDLVPSKFVSEVLNGIGHIYPLLEINRPVFK